MTQTSDPAAPVPPKLPPSAQALYDSIMEKIEPDLLAKNIPTLEKKYEGEAPEARKVRGKRYADAFDRFSKELDAVFTDLGNQALTYRRKSFALAEDRSRKSEAKDLTTLESQFS